MAEPIHGNCRASKILLLAALFVALSVGQMLTQTSAPQPTATAADSSGHTWRFEVVSIRQNKSDDAENYGLAQYGPTPDGWRMSNGSLALAILTAYVPRSGGAIYTGKQIEGQPEWTLNDRYDIDARIAEADRAEWQNPESQKVMLRAMLQAMLAERCKLAVHRETKELPVYSLVLRKDGPKFKQTDPTAPHPGGLPVPGGGSLITEDDGHTMHFYAVSMASLISLLSNWADRPVQDNTGLTGRYDFQLKRPALGSPSTQPVEGDSRPSIPSALEELGLRLESTKGPVEIFVVDHVERPSEN